MPTLLTPPPPIRTDQSNAFANNTMAARIPAIIQETIDLNPDYSASIKARMARLRDEIESGQAIRPLDIEQASDHHQWMSALRRQQALVDGELNWHNAEWFFAETYAYRRLIDAVRYYETGRDPFAPKKNAELKSGALWDMLGLALGSPTVAEHEIRRAVALDLWANRIDLSYAASLDRGTDINPEDLLVDDSHQLIEFLRQSASSASEFRASGTIYIVADNAGSELAMDLVLADRLLRYVTDRVVLYLKAHPTFVSDAIAQDVWQMLREMQDRGDAFAELSTRLIDNWEADRLLFLPHQYWNSSVLLRDMPTNLRERLNQGRLLVVKGDANYRRSVGDCLWPVETPFSQVMAYLDVPVLCLRTLKSDPIAGLPTASIAEQLDRDDPQWRVNGKRGLIQFKPQTSNNQ